MVTYTLTTQGTATAGLKVQSQARLKQNRLRKVLRSSQAGTETTTQRQLLPCAEQTVCSQRYLLLTIAHLGPLRKLPPLRQVPSGQSC